MNLRRYVVFFSAVIGVLLIFWGTVWLALIQPFLFTGFSYGLVVALFWGSFVFQLVRLIQFRKGDVHPWVVFFNFWVMGFVIHLWCAAVTKQILMNIAFFQAHELLLTKTFWALAVVFNSLGVWTALRGPYVITTKIPLPEHASDQLDGLKIVQISDLHVGPIIQQKYVKTVVQQIQDLRPDLLVFTGDIGDGDSQYYGQELLHFSGIHPVLGKYYVTGNHEYMWGYKDWVKSVQTAGIVPLLNQGIQLRDDLYLAGVHDISAENFDPSIKSNPVEARGSGVGYKILLAHQPKSCFQAEQQGFDLMLSGHTHNGQFFPFNLVVGFFNPYSRGLNQHGNMKVYVNQGTGFWGPPLRLGVKSEISLLILKKQCFSE